MGRHRKPSRTRRAMRRVLVPATLAAGFLLGMAMPTDAPELERYAPCATEDSPGPCYWDARIHGNGKGRSFIVHADQSVEYTSTDGTRY